MAKVTVALKPKYPTRRAVDKVIFNDGNFLTMIHDDTIRHILSQFDTCHVALVYNDEYYPVNVENYVEQYDLISSDEAPTVEPEENFGVRYVDHFVTKSESDLAKTIQDTDVTVRYGMVKGTLFKVTDYTKSADPSTINKNGYWMAITVDLDAASAEGYSNLKFMDTEEPVVNGENIIFMGNDASDVNKKIFGIVGNLTVDNETGDFEERFEIYTKTKVLMAADDINTIDIDGVGYDTLEKAFASLKGRGGKITVNRSITTDAVVISLDDGEKYTLELMNGVTVSLGKYIKVSNGCSLDLVGEGTIQETTPYFAPIIPINLDESKSVVVWISKGITLKGWAGIMVDKASYNVIIYCYGKCVGMNDGSADGAGVYVNGNVKSGSVIFSGSTEGTAGIGMYIAGNVQTTVNSATVVGTISGIEQRAGRITIGNSRVEGGMGEPAMKANGSGSTSENCGLAIAQHGSKKPIDVYIYEGATLIGGASFMEGNPQNNPDATKDTTIKVDNGTFVGPVKTMSDTDCTHFLYGGHYTEEPEAKHIAKFHEAIPADTLKPSFDIVVKD